MLSLTLFTKEEYKGSESFFWGRKRDEG